MKRFSRTQFLSGAAAAFAASTVQAGNREDIVVIGAGMAGIAAARRLSARANVTVLEARDRVGGRIWTDRSAGFAADMGAAWIHGINGNPVYRNAKAAGMRMFTSDFESVALFDNGSILKKDEAARIGAQTEKLMQEIRRAKKTSKPGDSVESVLAPFLAALPRTVRRGVSFEAASDIIIEYAQDAGALSLTYFDEDDSFRGDDVLFPDGFAALPLSHARGLNIKTGHVVSRVDISGDRARITTNRGVLQADRVVITLPLGVLQSGQVAFSPALPAQKRAAIGRLSMGAMNKVLLVFPKSFWPGAHKLGALKDEPSQCAEFWNLEPVTKKPALVCLTGGKNARALDSMALAEAANFAMSELKSMFGSRIPAFEKALRTSWSTDPFARGAYSSVPPGSSMNDYDILAQSVEDTLYFAGEATNSAHPATVHGAWISGERAADEIIADL